MGGAFSGLRFSRGVVAGDVRVFLLDLFMVFVFLRFAVYFVFPGVMLSLFVAPSLMVVTRGRGSCGM